MRMIPLQAYRLKSTASYEYQIKVKHIQNKLREHIKKQAHTEEKHKRKCLQARRVISNLQDAKMEGALALIIKVIDRLGHETG